MRDVEQTKSRILDAAREILAREGFAGLGVNALAAEAGVGKPLIYRYFGNMAGVAAALAGGSSGDSGPGGAVLGMVSSSEAVKSLVGYGRRLAGDRTRRDMLAWSLAAGEASGEAASETGEAADAAAGETGDDGQAPAARDDGGGGVVAESPSPPAPVSGPYADADPAAVMAILQAATAFLLIYGDRHGSWAGMPLSEPRHLARMERAMAAIARATLSGPKVTRQ